MHLLIIVLSRKTLGSILQLGTMQRCFSHGNEIPQHCSCVWLETIETYEVSKCMCFLTRMRITDSFTVISCKLLRRACYFTGSLTLWRSLTINHYRNLLICTYKLQNNVKRCCASAPLPFHQSPGFAIDRECTYFRITFTNPVCIHGVLIK